MPSIASTPAAGEGEASIETLARKAGTLGRRLAPLPVPCLMLLLLGAILLYDPRPRTLVRQLPGDPAALHLLLELSGPRDPRTPIPMPEGMIKLRDMVKAGAFGPQGKRRWVMVRIDLYRPQLPAPVTLTTLRFPYEPFAASRYWTLAKILNLADRVELSDEGNRLAIGLCRSRSARRFGRNFCALAGRQWAGVASGGTGR